MGIERKLRYTLIVTSVWFEDAQKKGNDIEKKTFDVSSIIRSR